MQIARGKAPSPSTDKTEVPPRGSLAPVVLLSMLAVLSSTLLFAEQWLFTTWDELSTDEILYHLATPLTGTDTYTIQEFLTGYLPFLVLVAAALIALVIYGRRKGKLRLAGGAVAAICACLIGYALYDFYQQAGMESYLRNVGSDEDYIAEHYRDPRDVDIAFPEQKRNLVYIFLESMEITCADVASGGAFEQNVIPELTKLAFEGEMFAGNSGKLNGAFSLPGATWTSGAMFAQTSGLPLKLGVSANSASSLGSFFPDLVALGDILEDEGYRQDLLIGSDAEFGARDLYFTEHGGYEMLDYPYALETGAIPEDYKVFWGYEDEKLFSFARERLDRLAAQGQPFNLTMLTVDTHFEDGYVCELCGDEFGDDQYANVHACSSRQVTDFVRWIQQQDFYANTTIVLCGDHITMDKDFYEDVPADYPRRTYTLVLNAPLAPADASRERLYSTFDLFPTTLAALGASFKGDQLGLGVNLFGTEDTLLEAEGLDDCEQGLSAMSTFLERFGTKTSIGAGILGRFARQAELRFDLADDGSLVLELAPCSALSSSSLKGVWAEVTDDRDGSVATIQLEVVQNEQHARQYVCRGATSFSPSDMAHLTATAFISAGDFEAYPVAELTQPDPQSSSPRF